MKSALWIALTLAAYLIGLAVRQAARRHPLANPVLIAMVIVIAFLSAIGASYGEYFSANQPIVFLLGPATVALGVPLAANFHAMRQNWRAALIALLAGCVMAMLSGFLLVWLLGGSSAVALSMLPKSATTPIAIVISQQIGGLPALSAVFAILGGILAAMTLRAVLGLVRVRNLHALGLAGGTIGSGIGAAYAATFGDDPAAFAAIGLSLNGLATSILSPLVPVLVRLVHGH
jgi:putative effector of murein hydrolase